MKSSYSQTATVSFENEFSRMNFLCGHFQRDQIFEHIYKELRFLINYDS